LTTLGNVYGVSVSQIVAWNKLSSPNNIKVGDILSVNGVNVYDEINKEQRTFSTQKDFLTYVSPIAEKVAAENNLYTSIMIAQAAHESAWGKSSLATKGNNLFGIKGSYKGNSIVMLTWEETKT